MRGISVSLGGILKSRIVPPVPVLCFILVLLAFFVPDTQVLILTTVAIVVLLFSRITLILRLWLANREWQFIQRTLISILSGFIALAIIGLPYFFNPGMARTLALLDNDNIYVAEVASHYAQGHSSAFENWDSSRNTLGMPRLVGVIVGRFASIMNVVLGSSIAANIILLISALTVLVFTTFAGIVTFTALNNRSAGKLGVIRIIYALALPVAFLLGEYGNQLNMGAVGFVFTVALCLWLASSELAGVWYHISAALVIFMAGASWPLYVPTAISAVLIHQSVQPGAGRFGINRKFLSTIIPLAIGLGGVFLLFQSGYRSRSLASLFNDYSLPDWSLGTMPHPVGFIALGFLALIIAFRKMNSSWSLLFIVQFALLFAWPCLFFVISLIQGVGQDGYYLSRVWLAAATLFLATGVSLVLDNSSDQNWRAGLIQTTAASLFLVFAMSTFYPKGVVPWYVANSAIQTAGSAQYLIERFDPNRGSLFDGQAVLNAVYHSNQKSADLIVPSFTECSSQASLWYATRWVAILRGKQSAINAAFRATWLIRECDAASPWFETYGENISTYQAVLN